ncbi:MAG: histidine phosphatase family protein [Vallitaleaceae bacterium]|nr:histidine phosphatase family protein [Vallitaleaceae bacterium]
MKLLIIRHGDPDYAIDSLTEKGWREAEYLSKSISDMEVKAFYVSPLGRAKDTASVTRVVRPNNDTLVMFCHFGVECIMLGHLLGISPMVLWHGFCAAPTSVTTLVTEERRKGIASFRMSTFGDIFHLHAAGEKAAFAARFCEMYDNMDERHD